MRRLICLVLCLMLVLSVGLAEEPASFFEEAEAQKLGKITRTYDSPTLKYTVDKFLLDRELAYLTRVWVKEPGRQIRKATSGWQKNVKKPEAIAKKIEGLALAVNGSGFVSPLYPWIPEDYPGTNKDYYYTPLGSLTVTDGEVFRNLEGVSYYGLALDEDGLQMYVDADNEEVLATSPTQTWSFYVGCPMLLNNEDILPEEWDLFRMAVRQLPGETMLTRYQALPSASRSRSNMSFTPMGALVSMLSGRAVSSAPSAESVPRTVQSWAQKKLNLR